MAVIKSRRVAAHPVDAEHVALILDGPRPKQGIPRPYPGLRPGCRIDSHVIIRPSAAPHGETKVVAHHRQDTETLVFQYDPDASGSIQRIFAAERKKVPFVVPIDTPVRKGEHEPVVGPFSAVTYDKASGQGDTRFGCRTTHPLHRRPLHRFGQSGVCSHESRGEHLRQKGNIRIVQGTYQPPGYGPIGRRLSPLDIHLKQCCPQYHLHEFSAKVGIYDDIDTARSTIHHSTATNKNPPVCGNAGIPA